MDEFGLIGRYFAPLADAGAFGLRDDAAQLPSGQVVTNDVLVAGVHFLPDDPLDQVAQKALRVNVSDLTAKGAQPTGYLLGIAWPAATEEADIALFCQGLAADQSYYDMRLLGGDTTRHTHASGPLTISVTMIGTLYGDCTTPVLRSGAKPGDAVYVTGTIGDAGLGLRGLTEGPAQEDVIEAYRRPAPPWAFGPAIAAFASAAVDVSDGLLADAHHLALASEVRLGMEGKAIPLSAAGKAAVDQRGFEALGELIRAGDDYQTLFTSNAPPEHLAARAEAAGIRLTRIGLCAAVEPPGVVVADEAGAPMSLGRVGGFQHF